VADADLFKEKSTASWLLVTGLFWEKNTASWWLISQTNRVYSLARCRHGYTVGRNNYGNKYWCAINHWAIGKHRVDSHESG
jgi:hypothetical protein